MKDAVATMGTILPDDAGGRDAVHVAVIAVVADSKLAPGQDVGLLTGIAPNGEKFASAKPDEKIGIVDPFLKSMVWPNQRFWLYLYPRTITGLSHKWTHPAFPEDTPGTTYAAPAQKLSSEQWLRDFVKRADCPDYDTVLAAAVGDHEKNRKPEEDPAGYEGYFSSNNDGEYLYFGGRDAHGEIPPEFWDHVEIVTGRKIEKRAKYFTCSC